MKNMKPLFSASSILLKRQDVLYEISVCLNKNILTFNFPYFRPEKCTDCNVELTVCR